MKEEKEEREEGGKRRRKEKKKEREEERGGGKEDIRQPRCPRLEDCQWTNGYQFDTALLLSVFLGMFGADR